MVDDLYQKLDFLSNDDLARVLRSILEEMDLVASIGAHRSTLYLAASAIEALSGDLVKLKRLEDQKAENPTWPVEKVGGQKKHLESLTFEEKLAVLEAASLLPKKSQELFQVIRQMRNYVHPDKEVRKLSDLPSVPQSRAQVAVACLNALIELYKSLRFVAGQEWRLRNGYAKIVTSDKASTILLPAFMREKEHSILTSELQAERFQLVSFDVLIPKGFIFNFIYNYEFSRQFRGARVDGRGRNGSGGDNGRLVFFDENHWSRDFEYSTDTEPDPESPEHTVRVTLGSRETFSIEVDGKLLVLDSGRGWDFDPTKKFGFMAEHGPVTISNLVCVPALASGASDP